MTTVKFNTNVFLYVWKKTYEVHRYTGIYILVNLFFFFFGGPEMKGRWMLVVCLIPLPGHPRHLQETLQQIIYIYLRFSFFNTVSSDERQISLGRQVQCRY